MRGIWLNVDPLAELYYSWSPYVYVGNNPMRRTDPTGMYWDDEKSKKYAESLTKNINKEISSKQKSLDKLNANIAKNEAKGKDVSKDQNKASGIQSDIDNLNSSVSEIGAMGDTNSQAFAFNMTEGDTGGTYFENGTIVMDIAGNGHSSNGIHEASHGYDVFKGGMPTTSEGLYATETKAYGRQFSLGGKGAMPSSDWQKVRSLGDVNARYVGGIKNSEGIYMYARQAYSYGLGRFGAPWNNNKFKIRMNPLKGN